MIDIAADGNIQFMKLFCYFLN